MDNATFWRIVDEVSSSNVDPEEKCSVLKGKLAQLPGDQVLAFEELLTGYRDQAYRWDVWAVAYIIGGGCSDDSFDDFRYTQIFRGRSAFERLLADPDSIADESFEDADAECFFEGFQYVPNEVCEDMKDFQFPDEESTYVHPSEPTGTKWEEDDLPKVCPKTWAKYGWENET